MNTITSSLTRRRRDPFDVIGAPTPFGRLYDAFMGEPGMLGVPLMNEDLEDTLPLDVSETESEVFVRASLPGFKRDEVSVEVDENVLCITAQHHETQEESSGIGDEKWIRRERRETQLARTVNLPTSVDQGKAKADLKEGVLTLKLPKAVKSNRRKIAIGS
ncbi:MAG: HSP20 family protein [Phycisphaerales bacterium]|jgi:HSP20 family protein